MKKTILSLLTILFFLFLLSSCLDNDTETLSLGEVNLQITEELPAGSGHVHFNFMTVEEYECLNFPIRYTSQSDEQSIDIDLTDIEKTNVCLTPKGPAFANVDLGNYYGGSYPVNIRVSGVDNAGTLKVDEDMMIIGFTNPQMLNLVYDTLLRIPEDIIWGLVGYYYPGDTEKVNAFLDSLQQIGAQPRTLPYGEYGYFQTDTAGRLIAPEGLPYNLTKTFVFDYALPMEPVQDVIDHYASLYYNDLYIYLYNSQGEIYLSDNL